MSSRTYLKSPLCLLVLLGLVCQGFSWENLLMPVLYALLWLAAMGLHSSRRRLPESMELVIFFAVLVGSLRFVGDNAYFRLIAMGNALAVLQLMRLTSPMTPRNKFISLMIAVTHLAVGSQFILGYPFILVVFFTLLLLPGALSQAHLPETGHAEFPILFRGGIKAYLTVFLIMAVFFVGFPRKRFVSGRDAGAALGRGPLGQRMDMISGGAGVAGRPFLRVRGDNLRYLKSFALDSFDGNTWRPSEQGRLRGQFFSTHNLDECDYRHVTVLDLSLLGSTIPVDRNVRHIKGNFFQSEYMDGRGTLVIGRMFPQTNNYYEYWSTEHSPEQLSRAERDLNSEFPPQSPELWGWIDTVLEGETDPEKQVGMLEKHLKTDFTYVIGAPDLNRGMPVDDFVFNQRSGHCERFASALALFCRMLGIPARVAIGFMVPPQNQFADYHSVRMDNAHAWVEAYLPGKGWRYLDGTPYSEQLSNRDNESFVMTLRDWLDFVWYSKIVEFSSSDQVLVLSWLGDSLKATGILIQKHVTLFAVFAGLFVAAGLLRAIGPGLLFVRRRDKSAISLETAQKFYSDMLAALAKMNLCRQKCQTPYEFASGISGLPEDVLAGINLLTENFCRVKYGGMGLNASEAAELEQALETIRSCPARSSGRGRQG